MKEEELILVDKQDKEMGIGKKMEVHKKGLLHRAFSVLVFNTDYELLIQRRAMNKYHWPGIWANTCCSHPRPEEKTIDAAHRRLKEEMGFDCHLRELFTFQYRAKYSNGLIENEIDHVFKGLYQGSAWPNREEVEEFKWMKIPDIKKDILKQSEIYAPWLKIIIEKYNW